MSENLSENEHVKEVHEARPPKHNPYEKTWIKYLMIAFGAFLGAFLAVYFVVDVTIHRFFYPPSPAFFDSRDIDKMIEQQSKDMDKFASVQTFPNPFLNPFAAGPVKVQTFEDDDSYKVVVDLRPFNGDEKNIVVKARPHKVSIEGKYDFKNKHAQKDVSFSQSFSLPEEIEVDKVTKEKKGNSYIITLPFED